MRDFHDAMQPHANGGHYVNFLGYEEGRELRAQVRDSCSPESYSRLVTLKDEWDPGNIIRRNHNIPPSGS